MEAAIVILDMKEKIAIYGNVKLIVIIMVYVSTAHVFANLALVENFVIKKYVKMIWPKQSCQPARQGTLLRDSELSKVPF